MRYSRSIIPLSLIFHLIYTISFNSSGFFTQSLFYVLSFSVKFLSRFARTNYYLSPLLSSLIASELNSDIGSADPYRLMLTI